MNAGRCRRRSPRPSRRPLAPYFTNLDRPVFALVNLPETVKGALFARYSRSAKPLRRLFLDEFYSEVGGATATSTRRPRARGAAVRARLQRIRRRLGRAARRRPPRRRERVERADEGARARPPDGVSRAVHTLHPVHRAQGRPLALSRAVRARAGTRSARASSRRSIARSRSTRAGSIRCAPGSSASIRRPPAIPTRSTARPFARRRSTRIAACCRPRPSRTSASTGPGQAYEALILRMRAHPLIEVRETADAMLARAAEGHSRLSHPRRSTGPRRALDGVSGRHARAAHGPGRTNRRGRQARRRRRRK